MAAKKNYNEDSIDVLSGIEGFRMAPTMYLGELGDAMVFRMVKEVADNVYDEFSSGRNKYMEVVYDLKSNTYLVADAAQGIPVGHKKIDGKNVSTLTAVFTRAHAGGKFRSEAYKTSAGTHGIGVAAVNAVSAALTVWTKREGQWWTQTFRAGVPEKEHPVKCSGPAPKLKLNCNKSVYGTVVEFTPDQSVVSIDAARGKKIKNPTVARLDEGHAVNWLRDMAMLNPGFTITVADGKKRNKFVNTRGLEAIVEDKLEAHELTAVNKKPIIYRGDYLSFGISWANTADADLFSSYVNTSPTADHGSHVKGFTDALARAVKEYATAKDKYKQSDLLAGAVGFLNWKMHGAQYSSQIKDKLVSNVAKEVEEIAFDILQASFKANAKLAKDIIKRAVTLGKGREDLANVIRSVGEVKKKGKGAFLPDILTMCPDAKPEERELYLVEGDSAGGSAINARDIRHQEILKLKGKPLNGLKASLADLLKNEVTSTILTALGVDLKSLDVKADKPSFAVDKLRVRNLILLADADPDGDHINVLILALVYRLLPDLMRQGRVFVVRAPLYNALVQGKHYGGATFDECFNQLPKGTPKTAVIRAKGWGEVSVDVMDVVAFNYDSRFLSKIQYPTTHERELWFKAIVAEDASARRSLLGLA